MNRAERETNKKAEETVARRASQGWSAEQIAKRVWFCYGYLCGVKGNILTVKMAGGYRTFEIGGNA